MKKTSAKQKQAPKQSNPEVESPTLKLTRSRFNRAKQQALATKAAAKRAKKALKKAKRDAKAARKRVKELKRELNDILANVNKSDVAPAKKSPSNAAPRTGGSKAKVPAKVGTKSGAVGAAGTADSSPSAPGAGSEQGVTGVAAGGRSS